MKNPETKQSKAARSLRADWRLALTGTPVENNVAVMPMTFSPLSGSRRRGDGKVHSYRNLSCSVSGSVVNSR